MYSNLLILIVVIALVVRAFLKEEHRQRSTDLIKHLSFFALSWGFLGLFIGLIGAFDSIEMASDVSSGVLAAGLKVGLLAPSFGIVVFSIARLGLIALALKKQ